MKYKFNNIELEIDWSVFKDMPEQTCYCRCEHIYRSHVKGISKDRFYMISQKPCPKCNKNVNNCRRYQSDPEKWTL